MNDCGQFFHFAEFGEFISLLMNEHRNNRESGGGKK